MGERLAVRRIWLIAVALITVIALVVTACGGGDDSSADGDDEEEGAQSDVTSPPNVTVAAGDPVNGGTLTFGLEAETDGWDPTANRWAVSGFIVAATVFDPLATYNADGEIVPYLAKAFVPNEDFTEWDIQLREGVVFHNGEPLNADAVAQLIEAHRSSGLSGPAFAEVESVEVVDDLTVHVSMATPWSSFPVVLTAQTGYVPAPEQLNDEEGARNPIGTGPFKFEDWTPEAQFVVSKNEDYWQEGLPYLDEVVFKPITDQGTRLSSLETREIDLTHTTDDELIVDWREKADEGEAQIIEDGSSGEETFIMLNTESPPLDDVRVRQALAYATDKESYIDIVGSGILDPANGPYNEASFWYNPEVTETYPQYDPAKAQALVDEYEAEEGPIEFDLGSQAVATSREANEVLAQQWEAVGIDVTLKETEQAQLITDALVGRYDANQWRQFGQPDPDGDYVWWVSENAAPIDEIALNFARNKDPELDAAMAEGRESADPDVRKEAYDKVQLRLAEDLPYIWLNHTLWALIADNRVRNLANPVLPDGEKGMGLINGQTRLTQVWVVDD